MTDNNMVKKTYYVNPIQCKRMEIILNVGEFATESELIRRALNIGLDQIEKEIDRHKE